MMEVQANLRFDAPPAQPRRVRVTSLESFRAIRGSLPERELAVIDALVAQRQMISATPVRPPTAYELVRLMAAFDVNSVRPRLTALKDRGLVKNGDKVICTVTRKKAFTWVLADEVREVLNLQES